MKMDKPLVDIIMLTYGRIEYTKMTLNSLFENTKWPYRLIVTDNGSVDGTREYLRKLTEEGKINRLLLPKTNLGNAGGKNFNLQQAETEYVCLLDNDMLLLPGWLTEEMECLLHFKKEKLALMSPWPIWKYDVGLKEHKKHKIGELKDGKFHVYLTRKLSGQVWVGNRKVLLKCGGFVGATDGRFMGFYASPLSKELIKQGYKIGCVAGKELAISIDRKGSEYRIESEMLTAYRTWNKLQKNKKHLLPDFHVWLKEQEEEK